MSKFSEKLSSYITSSGYNVYQLAKEASLDRTTLQKTARGQRLPSLDYIKDICQYIKISKKQEAELVTLYQIEKQGQEIVDSWKEIDACLNDIQKIRESEQTNLIFPMHFDEQSMVSFNAEIQHTYTSESECIKAIMCMIEQEVIEQKNPEIFMDVSWASKFALEQCVLQTNEKQPQKLVCHQLVNLRNTEIAKGGLLDNLKMLHQILPYAFAPQNIYDVRYTYVNETCDEQKYHLWEHYIVTHRHVLLCSNTEHHMVVISNEKIAASYREEIMDMIQSYRPLLDYQGFSGDGIRRYRKMTNYYETHVTYESFPCLTLMFPEEMRKQILSDPKLKSYASAYFEIPKVSSNHHINIFGMKGIKAFIETGHLPGLLDSFFVAETMDVRKCMLQTFYDQLVHPQRRFYMINEEVFNESEAFGIEMYGRNRVVFCSSSADYPFGFISIDEPGICDIFASYFDNFVQSHYVYSIEETIVKFEEIVRRYFAEISE